VILNLTPVPRLRYRLGLSRPGKWLEVLTVMPPFMAAAIRQHGQCHFEDIDSHNQSYSAEFVLPPLSIIAFRPERPIPMLSLRKSESISEVEIKEETSRDEARPSECFIKSMNTTSIQV